MTSYTGKARLGGGATLPKEAKPLPLLLLLFDPAGCMTC
jgi:hypothetical protein